MTKNAIPTHHMALIHVIKERIKTAEILDSTMISAVFTIYAILDATGFEPATSASRTQRSTKLSHATKYIRLSMSFGQLRIYYTGFSK